MTPLSGFPAASPASSASRRGARCALGDHPFDAARRDSGTGEQLCDALRPFFPRRTGLRAAGRCAGLAGGRHAAPGHASFVAKEVCLSYGVWMLFGKRKRIVNRILIVEDEPLTAFDNEF